MLIVLSAGGQFASFSVIIFVVLCVVSLRFPYAHLVTNRIIGGGGTSQSDLFFGLARVSRRKMVLTSEKHIV